MDILTAIGSKIGEYLVAGTIHQARYLFCFNSIVEDLKNEETNLKLAQDGIKERVEREERNTKEIEKVVEKWLKDAGDAMADVQRLKAEIEEKKSCLNGWCPNWGCRYWLGRKATKKTSIMLKLQNTGNFSTVAHLKPLPGIEFSSPRDFMSFKATELASDQLIEALNDENTKLVGLYGAGGVGKTTLATVVGHKLQQQQVFDEVVIATVSQNPNILDVQTKLAESLSLELKEVTKEDRAKRLYLRFTETKSKILVILDDVWKQHDLKNEFGIPLDDNLNGCKILLTTRRKQVCGRNLSITLGILEPEEGLALLKRHADIDDRDSTLIDVSKEIAGECKGLPLAIVAVGSALRLRGKDVDEWNLVSQKLKTAELDDVDDVDVNVYACLKLSYDYLKDYQTKLCFLLCSLFPEDFEIDLEELVRYGVGLGWYSGVETIEKARSLFRGMIKGLKDSSLLLDAGMEGFVKMHDVVRDVAIQIGLKEEKFFIGVGLTEWPQDDGLKQCRAISLLRNKKNVLPPNGLVCPNLHTLILGNDKLFSRDKFIVPDQFFDGMTALKVVNIRGGDLSIKSLQFLTDLQVLQLIACKVRDIAFLGKLKRLQILSLKWSFVDEIPDDLAVEISKLKLLDLNVYVVGLEVRISLIKRFSQLQEFYGTMTREVGGTNAECLSKDTAFPQLQRYEIFIGEAFSYVPGHGRTNALSINNTEATSLIIFSALYQNVQYLYLKKVKGCQNILPNIDQRGLKELTVLELWQCKDLECIMDVSQHVKSQSLVMLSRLATLRLIDLQKLQWIWKAPAQHVDLQNLTEVEVFKCNNLTYLFSLSQAQSLLQLKKLKVQKCEKLEYIIEAKIDNNERRANILERDEFVQGKHVDLRSLTEVEVRDCNSLTYLFSLSQAQSVVQLRSLVVHECEKLEHIIEAKIDNNERRKNILEGDEYTIALPMLKELKLRSLPNLTTTFCLTGIADEFVQAKHLELRNLTKVKVEGCNSLTYLFSLSQAQSLVQLKKLKVKQCEKLEHIIEAKIDNNERRKNIVEGDEYTIPFPMLKKLALHCLPNLTTLSSECYFPTCQALQKLSLIWCPHLTCSGDEFVLAENLQYLYLAKVKCCQNILRSIDQGGFYELTTLIVTDCEDIECILDASQRVGLQKTTVLPKLRELMLGSLPNLTTFCSKYDHSIWPALQNLTLVDCPRLTINSDEFVQNLVENLQYLHLENVKGFQNILRSIDQRGFYELTTLIVRDCEDIECILDASQRVGIQKTTLLPKLRELTLESLPNITTFCSKYDHSIWPALQKLTLVDCPRLTINTNTDEFVQNLAENLQYLHVERCYYLYDAIVALLKHGLKNLENLCIGDFGAQVGFQLSDIIVEGQENKLFPSFRRLGNLQYLHVERCYYLYDAIVALLKHGIKNLEHLCIGDFGAQVGFQLSDIIVEGQENKLFPSFRTLGLYRPREMEVLYKGPTHFFCRLQNLTSLYVQDCDRLRHLLTPTLARNLLQLDGLSIRRCLELEQVIKEDEEEDHLPRVCFPKLRRIIVQSCPKLKHLFHISVAQSLQNLSWLRLDRVDELEEVFWHEDGAVVVDDNKIVMTKLYELELKDLPNLTNCWPEGYQLTFPSLWRKTVENCPKLRTNFAAEGAWWE